MYEVDCGDEHIVGGFLTKTDGQVVVQFRGEGGCIGLYPKYLTHQRPVLDADGVPIKVGGTVYFTDGREQECNTVVNAEYSYKDEPYVQLGRLNDVGYPTYTNCSCIDPSKLTHTKPEKDTWDRINEESQLSTCEYFDHMGGSCHDCTGGPADSCHSNMMADVVNRCKALAEVSE